MSVRRSIHVAVSALALSAAFFAGAWSSESPVRAAQQVERRPVVSQFEFDQGTFECYVPGQTHPVGTLWVRPDGSGGLLETWDLFRPNQSDGWVFPSSTNTTVVIRFEYIGAISHGSDANFLTWSVGRYPSGMSVNSGDFVEHFHTVAP